MRLSSLSRGVLPFPLRRLTNAHRCLQSPHIHSPLSRSFFNRRKPAPSPTALESLIKSLSDRLSSSSLPLTSQLPLVRQLTDAHLALHRYPDAAALLWRLCDAQTRARPTPPTLPDVLDTTRTMSSLVNILRAQGLQPLTPTIAALDDLVDRYAALVSTSVAGAEVVDHPTLVHFVASVARSYVDLGQQDKATRLLRSQLLFDERQGGAEGGGEEGKGSGQGGRVSDGRGLRYATAYNFLGIAAYPPPHEHSDACAHDDHSHAPPDWSASEAAWQRALSYCQPLLQALSSPASPEGAAADLPSTAAESVFTADSVPLHLLRCYAMTQDNRAQALYAGGREEEGLAVMEEALAVVSRLLPPFHADVVRTRQQFIGLLLPSHPHLAHAQADALLALDRRDVEPELAAAFDAVAQQHFQHKHFAIAARLFQKSIDIRTLADTSSLSSPTPSPTFDSSTVPPASDDPPADLVLAARYNDLAMCELRLKAYAQAESHLRISLAIKERLLGAEHWELAVSAHNLGTALMGLRRYPEAEVALLRAWGLYEARSVEGEGEEGKRQQELLLGMLAGHLGQAYGLMERWGEAGQRYEEAVERKRTALGDHPAVTMDLSALAQVRMSGGEYDEARRVYEEVRAMSERMYGAEHVSACVCGHWLSVAEWKAGRREEAVQHAKRAVELGEHLRAKGTGEVQVQPDMMDVMRRNLADQLRGLGKDTEAVQQEHLLTSKA